jgi:hypothetical protein
MTTIRLLFIIAAIPYTLLIPLILFVDQATAHNSRSSVGTVFAVFCAGIYIYGSIFTLRERYSLRALIVIGAILNLIATCYWMPFLFYQELRTVGVIGVGLTFAWLIAILGKYRTERQR